MITIIYGDDIVVSRKLLEQEKLKNASNEIINLNGTTLTFNAIIVAGESSSLFSVQKTIIIENLLKNLSKKTKELEKITHYLSNQTSSHTFILWEQSEITQTLIKRLPKAKIIHCQLPVVVFKFLDSLAAVDYSTILSLFHTFLENREAEFIYVMLLRQFRYLIIGKDLGVSGFKDISPWQAKKFTSQSRYFTMAKLVSSYRQLLSLDYKIKTGQTPYTLAELLDIFLGTL